MSVNENQNEYFVFRNPEDNKVYCVRTIPPRITAKCTQKKDTSDIAFEDFFYIDQQSLTCVPNGLKPDPLVITRIMEDMGREVAYFLEKEKEKTK